MDKYKIAIRALKNLLNSDIDIKENSKTIYLTGAFYMLCVIVRNDKSINVKQMLEIFDYFDSFFEKIL